MSNDQTQINLQEATVRAIPKVPTCQNLLIKWHVLSGIPIPSSLKWRKFYNNLVFWGGAGRICQQLKNLDSEPNAPSTLTCGSGMMPFSSFPLMILIYEVSLSWVLGYRE